MKSTDKEGFKLSYKSWRQKLIRIIKVIRKDVIQFQYNTKNKYDQVYYNHH